MIPNYENMLYADKRRHKKLDLETYRLGCQMFIHREGPRKDTGRTTERCRDCCYYNKMESIKGYHDRGLTEKQLEERRNK